MLRIQSKIALTVLGLTLMALGAIVASPVNAKFTPQPNPEPTCGCIGGTGSR